MNERKRGKGDQSVEGKLTGMRGIRRQESFGRLVSDDRCRQAAASEAKFHDVGG